MPVSQKGMIRLKKIIFRAWLQFSRSCSFIIYIIYVRKSGLLFDDFCANQYSRMDRAFEIGLPVKMTLKDGNIRVIPVSFLVL